MGYYFVDQQQLTYGKTPPAGTKPFKHQLSLLLPPLVSKLHASFQAWGRLGYSPGLASVNQVYVNAQGQLAFYLDDGCRPMPLGQVGVGPDLAAWLVMLDKWMETFVVIARARTIWNLQELASALSFVTPAFLPPRLVAHPPDNWERVASALAVVLADGSLQGTPTNQYWKQDKVRDHHYIVD
ncbi:MAG: hypothetical protein KF832_04325 [Caldilineaceae bacterium]|nr:hypothetical protein [Caldilineaceae bacterium]